MSNCNTSCSESDLNGDNQTTSSLYQPSTAVTIIQATMMIFTIITDILGNILVILSVLQNKKLRTSGNILVISLSAADLIVALYPYPLFATAIIQKKSSLDHVQCKVSSAILGLGLSGSIYNIMSIAINRYFCICHSSRYDKLYSMKNTYCYIFLTWVLVVLFLLPMAQTDALQYDPRVYSCVFILTLNPSLTIALASFQFIIPVTIVIFCYMRIWVLVIQAKYRVRQNSSQKMNFSEVRNFLTMFAVFVLFAVCWGPYSIIGLIFCFSPPSKAPKVPDWLTVLSYFMAYFNSCLNGIVYGIFNSNFRNEYKRIVLSFHELTQTVQSEEKSTSVSQEQEQNYTELEIIADNSKTDKMLNHK
ncbi:melatonin receptor type 1C-like [Protopterus annectens]|uniref:melatonin receptor type 1C-like n=1 Tax=Protopterus annectens TaxID=7888 RepID=UPI001CFB2D47|nr:melatonin receptor type 1C-like [Protopterus annectens]